METGATIQKNPTKTIATKMWIGDIHNSRATKHCVTYASLYPGVLGDCLVPHTIRSPVAKNSGLARGIRNRRSIRYEYITFEPKQAVRSAIPLFMVARVASVA